MILLIEHPGCVQQKHQDPAPALIFLLHLGYFWVLSRTVSVPGVPGSAFTETGETDNRLSLVVMEYGKYFAFVSSILVFSHKQITGQNGRFRYWLPDNL
jgi:hypothetical protein